MDNYKIYSSNTYAGTSNSFMLARDEGEIMEKTSRIFYRVIKSGKFGYKFLFSNNVDSTYEDGSRCVANRPCGEWEIISLRAGDGGEYDNPLQDITLHNVAFDGAFSKKVKTDEVFWTDEVVIDLPENHYLCVEITFRGNKIPFTPDKHQPSFTLVDGKFVPDKEFPHPVIVGCDRPVKSRIAFLGDSITQGNGTGFDKYEYWVAQIGRNLGEDYSICNMGLGCARAADAATNRAWLNRAKQFDWVFVCFGVNDISHPHTADVIGRDIEKIVDLLHEAGCKVGLLSTPPFDHEGDRGVQWYCLCDYLRNVLAKKTELFFETSDILGNEPPFRHRAKYGGHPDGKGGTALGNAFCDFLKENGYEF